ASATPPDGSGSAEVRQQDADTLLDLVADGADGVDALAGRVVEGPVLVARARHVGAGVATAHGDDDVGLAQHGVGPSFGVLGRDVDADFAHRLDRSRVDLIGGLATARVRRCAAAGQVG